VKFIHSSHGSQSARKEYGHEIENIECEARPPIHYYCRALSLFVGFCLITNTAGERRVYLASAIPLTIQLNSTVPADYFPHSGLHAS